MNTGLPYERLRDTLESGRVARYHAAPSVRPQSDGLHAWGVAVICLYLTDGLASAALLAEALLHDAPELPNGDIPFHVKAANPKIKALFDAMDHRVRRENLVQRFPTELHPKEVAILKFADTIEGLIWSLKTEERGGMVTDRWARALDRAFIKFAPLFTPDEIGHIRETVNLITNNLHAKA